MDIPIQFPFGGLNEDAASGSQPEGTTREAVNVRGTDPATGRMRGGVREGHSKATSAAAPGAAPIRLVEHTTIDRSGYTYSQAAEDAQTTEWMKQPPLGGTACRAVALDRQRNIIVIDGNSGVAKFNSSGELVWKFVLPVSSPQQVVRAIEVDQTSNAIYIGISEGGEIGDARIFKYVAQDDGLSVPNLEWTIFPSLFTERLRLRQGVLYAAQNHFRNGLSQITAYRLIDTAVPEVAWVRDQVPHPVRDMDIREFDGAVFTAHPYNANRGKDLRSPSTGKVAVDAEPVDIVTDHDEYAWCILDASDIDGDDTFNADYKTGDQIVLWIDKSGNGRNVYQPADVLASGVNPTNYSAPVLVRAKTFGANDAVSFNSLGTSTTSTYTCLVSQGNGSTASGNKQAQRTVFPGYTSVEFTGFVVFKATPDGQQRVLIGQDDSAANNRGRSICVNTSAGSGASLSTAVGNVFFYDESGTNTGYSPYDATNGYAVVSFQFDNTQTSGSMWVNGTLATSTWATSPVTVTEGTQIGCFRDAIDSNTLVFSNGAPFDGQIAYIATYDKAFTSTERIGYEGYLAWRFGVSGTMTSTHTYYAEPPTTSTNSSYWGASQSPYEDLTDEDQMLVKWAPSGGKPMWAALDRNGAGLAYGAIGYGVAVPKTPDVEPVKIPYVWSMGTSSAYTSTAGTNGQYIHAQAAVRQIQDKGETLELSGSGSLTWAARWGTSASYVVPSYEYPRMCISGLAPNDPDEFAATSTAGYYVYVPYFTGTPGSYSASEGVYVYAPTSANSGAGITNQDAYRTIYLSTSERGLAVAAPAWRPEYLPGQLSTLTDEFIVVGSEHLNSTGGQTSTISKIRLVDTARSAVPIRTGVTLAGTSTSLYRADGVFTSTSGGTGVIRSSGWIQAAQLYNRFYITDGSNYVTFDPRMVDAGQNGAVRTWKAKGSGEIPKRCRLIAQWRSRIVLARGAEDPTNWFMSRVGDPEEWDFFPEIPDSGQAVAGGTNFAGRNIGVVNALVPFSDDLLYIGCDQGILRLTGDPADDGQLDLVTDSIGISFGEPWCRDPEGRLYFFGSRGGVYVAVPGQQIESISDDKIRRRLQDIDLSSYYIRLVWNWRAEGLHVYLCPFDGSDTAPTTSYFWERRTGAWWQDELPFAVTAARLVDGDGATDRAIYLGCSDGLIRKVDEDSFTDDGSAIYSRVLIGPLAGKDPSRQAIFKRPSITLASDLNGAECAFLTTDTPDVPGGEVSWMLLSTGQNDRIPIRTRGAYVWLRLRSADVLGRWAYENGQISVESGGMRRRTS